MPAEEPTTADDEEQVTAEAEEVAEEEISTTYRTIKFSGRFHPVMVHFPIAFLLAAAIMQWFLLITGKTYAPPIVTTMLWFGALGAVVAAGLGWAYAYDTVYFGDDEQLLFWHRWLGTATAVVAVIVLVVRRFLKPVYLAILLTIVAILVGLAGHYGASLMYGSDFFSEF